jgi:hypothetical protein
LIQSSRASSAQFSPCSEARFRIGRSRRLRAVATGLCVFLGATCLHGALGGDYRVLFLAPALPLLRLAINRLDPRGLWLVYSPLTAWTVTQRTDEQESQGPEGRSLWGERPATCELVVRGRWITLLWIEARVASAGRPESAKKAEGKSTEIAVQQRSWLLFADALPDSDWRRLRRILRIQHYSGGDPISDYRASR